MCSPTGQASADGVTFLSAGIEQAIATAKEAAGAKDVGVFGAGLAAQCSSAGLVDEIFVHLVPVLQDCRVSRRGKYPGYPPQQVRQQRGPGTTGLP